MKRLLPFAAALAVALAVATPLAVPAANAGVPARDATGVRNDNFAMIAAEVFAYHGNAASGHHAALVELHGGGMPGFLRNVVRVGSVHDQRFTITVAGDQACLDWSAGPDYKGGQTTPGACRPSERRFSRTPLTDSAARLGRLAERAAHDADGLAELLRVDTLSMLASIYAPAGVTIAGVSDHNHDGLEDDARVAFRQNGRVTCVQLPLVRHGRWQLFYTGCRTLPHRGLTPFAAGTVHQAGPAGNVSLATVAARLQGALAKAARERNVGVWDLSDAEVLGVERRVDLHGFAMERVAPGVFVVVSRDGCTARFEFTERQAEGPTMRVVCP